MLDWKTSFRSFYYANAEPPDDIILKKDHTALLVIDIQNTYLEPDEDPVEAARWQPFIRMSDIVIPNNKRLIDWARSEGIEVIFARIACQKTNGHRSLSQRSQVLTICYFQRQRR